MLSQLADFLSTPVLMDDSYAQMLAHVLKTGKLPVNSSPIKNDVKMAAEKQASAGRSAAGKITVVLPICGMIDERDSWVMEFMGGTSLQSIREALDVCANEPRVSGVVFDIYSGGGSAYGVKEAADYIYSMRSRLNMVSVSHSVMASAAYYLGSAAHRIYATPSSVTGSIGVAWVHSDYSKAEADAGITTTIFRIPETKMEGHPAEPLTDEAKQVMMKRCEQLYGMFTGDVAKYRGCTQQEVMDNYGKGRVLCADDAVKCGMIDRVLTFEDVVQQMASGTIARSLAQSNRMEGAVDTTVLQNRLAMAGFAPTGQNISAAFAADKSPRNRPAWMADSMPDAPETNPGGLFADLLHAATAAHMLHLQTRSFSQHMALGSLYEALPGAVDELIESYQGKYGVIRNYPSGFTTPTGSPLAFVQAQIANLKAKRAQVGDDTELQNLVDEIASLLDGTEYKLRFLA